MTAWYSPASISFLRKRTSPFVYFGIGSVTRFSPTQRVKRARSGTCQRAIVKQLFRYAFGRQETVSDQPVIDALVARFRDSGFRFRELVVALATSELFLQKGSG